jgi:hypothetical protein
MRSKIVALLLSSMLLAGIALAQTSTPSSSQLASILYDDFNQPLIDPLRWTFGGACWSSNFNEMEMCSGDPEGKLLLAHRNFGQRDTDTGNQFGQASLSMANPASIKSISAGVVVRGIEEVPCAANPQFGGKYRSMPHFSMPAAESRAMM